MKTIRNIFLVIIFGALVSFCLYMAPNYKKDENEDKTNLVINYTNVTAKMKGEVIIKDDGTIYISKDDIENYYDRYIYYDKQYNYIIATGNGKSAYFDISKDLLNINGEESKANILIKDDIYYIPISRLEEVYNIDVKYISEYDTVIIESLDKKLETTKTNKNVSVKYKDTMFSKSLEKLESGTKVSIVPDKDSKEWILIRTDNGNIGYIKSEDLTEKVIERLEPENTTKTISLAWEYFSEYAKAPKNDSTVKYDGVNVVSPSFFYIEDDKLKENVGTEGVNYIQWAKSNDYEVWAMIQAINDSTEKREVFSKWINDYKKRQELINQIVSSVKKYNLDGINIDFENINQSDKDAVSRFIIELKPALENVGAILSVDVTVPDGAPNWSLCFDRNVIGDVSDYLVVMTYDKVTKSSKVADSTAPYYWVENNIKKIIEREEVDSNKVIIGIPFYTILWEINGENVKGTTIAMKNIEKYVPSDVELQWLGDSQQQYIEYTKNGITYKMWIENDDSISQKLNLLKEYNLGGAAYWQKGYEDDNIFNIIKQKLFE